MDRTAVILTGGRSRRMGTDKALLPFGGETLLAYVIRRYSALFAEVIVSCNAPGRFDTPGVKQVYDNYAGRGPLAGLEAAFSQTEASEIFLTAVDIPLGEPETALRMMDMAGGRDACVIRRKSGLLEPLFAVYGRVCLEKARKALESGKLPMLGVIDFDKSLIIDEAQMARLSVRPVDDMLLNVNRPEDYERALELSRIDIKDGMKYNVGQTHDNLNQ